jgi:ABC-type glutathione transport system ATPase component
MRAKKKDERWLRQQLTAAAAEAAAKENPPLPIRLGNSEYLKCSNAIKELTITEGQPLGLVAPIGMGKGTVEKAILELLDQARADNVRQFGVCIGAHRTIGQRHRAGAVASATITRRNSSFTK